MLSSPATVLRVLLVEDDADHAELVRRGLVNQRAPVELTVCPDAEAALEYLRADTGSAPHLILLDLRLPKMSGLQLLREMKATPGLSAIPCVVLTTSEAEVDVARAQELQVSRYLVKPADHERLASLMADVERYWTESSRPRHAG
jgi:CheY-like chemotaxis protein